MTHDEARQVMNARNVTDSALMKLKDEEAVNKKTALHDVLSSLIREMRIRDRIASNERAIILKKLELLDTSG